MIHYTYTPVQYNEDYVYKLKLERLMYKAGAKAWYPLDYYNHARSERWNRLYIACRNKLEELKK